VITTSGGLGIDLRQQRVQVTAGGHNLKPFDTGEDLHDSLADDVAVLRGHYPDSHARVADCLCESL
jgi:hypothetical protein